jgi:hypothetical protein
VNDDWRLRVTLPESAHADALASRLETAEMERDLDKSLHDRVIITRDAEELFCYAGTREQAEEAQGLIQKLAEEHGWRPTYELRHWHPVAEQWEDPDVPLPEDDAARAAEHADLIEQERKDVASQEFPDFEVRITCTSHREAAELAEQLRGEGVPNVHRASYILVGAPDEDSANALADRLRADAPAGCEVRVEGSAAAAYAARGFKWYSLFGGLGG